MSHQHVIRLSTTLKTCLVKYPKTFTVKSPTLSNTTLASYFRTAAGYLKKDGSEGPYSQEQIKKITSYRTKITPTETGEAVEFASTSELVTEGSKVSGQIMIKDCKEEELLMFFDLLNSERLSTSLLIPLTPTLKSRALDLAPNFPNVSCSIDGDNLTLF